MGAAATLVLAGCSSSGGGTTTDASTTGGSSSGAASGKTLQIAYLSFAVTNSYDAPMLAAAKTEAADSNAQLTVFDANNDPKAQFSQLQNAITSGKYDGIITQPIEGTNLIPLVQQAIAKGIKVVNIDQILGSDLSTDKPQVDGLSANVTFVPTKIGTQLGQQVVAACASQNLDPCNVGYLYDIKASSLDTAMRTAFNAAIASTPSVKIVAEGQDFFTPAGGLKAVQDMLSSHSDLNLIVGTDQGLEGAVQALSAAKETGKILMVGYGASAAGVAGVTAGTWYSDVAQAPASEGRLGVKALVEAIRTGTNSGAIDPVAELPDDGVVTKGNAAQFTAEWPG
jgi:ribose transport system substrate-binding protein